YQIDEKTPSILIGDKLRLRQILINLIGNALKFTEQGEIIIRAKPLKIEGNAAEISFDVCDTGIGIPEDKQPRLFKAFSQIDSSTTRKYGGTGLGLAISSRLAALMNGSISVKSIPGRGSIFTFTIQSETVPRAAEIPNAAIHRKNALIVDDNASSRTILKTQLGQWGFYTNTVSSSEEALKIINKDSSHLVLIDRYMPQIDGITLAREIKKHNTRIPLVLMNPAGSELAPEESDLFNAVLTKPVKYSRLLKIIESEFRLQHILELEKKPADTPLLSDSFAAENPLRILLAEDNL